MSIFNVDGLHSNIKCLSNYMDAKIPHKTAHKIRVFRVILFCFLEQIWRKLLKILIHTTCITQFKRSVCLKNGESIQEKEFLWAAVVNLIKMLIGRSVKTQCFNTHRDYTVLVLFEWTQFSLVDESNRMDARSTPMLKHSSEIVYS